ncbi:uncharacterized protein [Diabrotica undecimpunctata]|uniref:uncharacterized protein isoform X5 n=1 Tax=Diabrotica undecimpunctata TaxID=50387 RepID=UPI003B637EB2
MEVKQEQPLCPIEECVVKTEFIGFPKVSVHSSLKTEIQEDQYVEDSIKNDTKSYFVDGCPSDHLNMDITVEDIKLEEDKAELVQIGDVMEIKHEIKQEVGEYDKESQLFTPIKLEDVKDEPPKGEDCSDSLEKNRMEIIKTLPERLSNKKRVEKHSGKQSYECETCLKSFSRRYALKVHSRTHTGEKPYNCKICFKSFSQSCDVKNHMTMHTGEKPYQCEICLTSFTRSGSLKQHIRLHTGEKPYQCKICLKFFTQSNNVNKHMRLLHPGENSS